ncbi:GPI transamidase component GPI16 [Striga asiatica]|uniref:GPI transamidase component GPI16 n=1 Tax=Striga asiatica TaxID=4170 RepID=A0A5A7Q6D5_STRAF|nr:GPI transamidase component GPI16 [Striga asiatica]
MDGGPNEQAPRLPGAQLMGSGVNSVQPACTESHHAISDSQIFQKALVTTITIAETPFFSLSFPYIFTRFQIGEIPSLRAKNQIENPPSSLSLRPSPRRRTSATSRTSDKPRRPRATCTSITASSSEHPVAVSYRVVCNPSVHSRDIAALSHQPPSYAKGERPPSPRHRCNSPRTTPQPHDQLNSSPLPPANSHAPRRRCKQPLKSGFCLAIRPVVVLRNVIFDFMLSMLGVPCMSNKNACSIVLLSFRFGICCVLDCRYVIISELVEHQFQFEKEFEILYIGYKKMPRQSSTKKPAKHSPEGPTPPEPETPAVKPKKMSSEIDDIFAAAKKRKRAEEGKKVHNKKPGKVDAKSHDGLRREKDAKKKSSKENGPFRPTSWPRKKTADGLTIYTEEELGIGTTDAGVGPHRLRPPTGAPLIAVTQPLFAADAGGPPANHHARAQYTHTQRAPSTSVADVSISAASYSSNHAVGDERGGRKRNSGQLQPGRTTVYSALNDGGTWRFWSATSRDRDGGCVGGGRPKSGI